MEYIKNKIEWLIKSLTRGAVLVGTIRSLLAIETILIRNMALQNNMLVLSTDRMLKEHLARESDWISLAFLNLFQAMSGARFIA